MRRSCKNLLVRDVSHFRGRATVHLPASHHQLLKLNHFSVPAMAASRPESLPALASDPSEFIKGVMAEAPGTLESPDFIQVSYSHFPRFSQLIYLAA